MPHKLLGNHGGETSSTMYVFSGAVFAALSGPASFGIGSWRAPAEQNVHSLQVEKWIPLLAGSSTPSPLQLLNAEETQSC